MNHKVETEFSHAVLAITTSVSVTLARKPVSLDQVLNLVPGSMLTFDNHCDEPLILEAGGKTDCHWRDRQDW